LYQIVGGLPSHRLVVILSLTQARPAVINALVIRSPIDYQPNLPPFEDHVKHFCQEKKEQESQSHLTLLRSLTTEY